MSQKRILVTGANGFLGKAVLQALKSTPYFVVTTDVIGDIDFSGDLANKEFVSTLPEVEIIIHCAAVQYVSTNLPLFSRTKFFERNNVLVAKNLSTRYSGKVENFINVGTSMMYDKSSSIPISGNSSLSGNGVYSESKTEAWNIFSKMNNPTAMMVPCIIAGPGRGGLFVDLISSINKRHLALCPGQGTFLTQMVHVEDAASLLVKIATSSGVGIFNAGGKDPLSINDWISMIIQTLGKSKVTTLHIPLSILSILSKVTNYRLLAKEQVSMLRSDHILDTSDSEKLGWIPKHSNKEIIISTAKYFV